MAIKIIDSPDPLSDVSLMSRGPSSTPLLVESSASRVLRQELQRYCEGLINGRSFLIAGHRGAGKTTLVAKAFMDVRQASGSGASMLRPLFIPLHGPSLFPDPAAQAAAVAATAAAVAAQAPATPTAAALAAQALKPPDAKPGEPPKSDAKPPVSPRKSDAQIALEQITLGLHRAVAREFAVRYRMRADELAWLRRTPNQAARDLRNARSNRSPAEDAERQRDEEQNDLLPDEATLGALIARIPHDRELFELAGQFEAELHEGPSPERLREFWDRAHALSGGVLFPGGFAPLASGITGLPTPPVPGGLFPNLVEVHGQGVRELVALSGVVEAYRRISGDYKRSEGEKSARSQTSERTTGFDATKELAAPIASLITGGLAGTGLAISGTTPAVTALGGIVTALGASLVFKATSTRKRERSSSRETQFIYDLSVATLDRILPILIERLRAAGLAPVFVVDELDKVKELSTRLVSMVHHLKKLVAENAFFCFLTNRSYFEEMLAEGAGRPYPVEYTYYTERLFVAFSPEDFERYLRSRIPDPVVEQAEAPVVSASSGPANIEATACAHLRWALRHRSQLHVVDLQREIAALRDDEGRVRTRPDVITSARRNLIDLTFQVAIELTLAQDEVEQVLLDRPEFRRLVHDAMYFISRRWLEGQEEIDLSDTGLPGFMTYLEGRTGREEEWPKREAQPDKDKRSGTDDRPNESGRATPRPSVTLKDADFLFDQTGVLADFLSDRASVDPSTDWRRERLAAWNAVRKTREIPELEPDILDALLVSESASLLQREGRPGIYRFRYRVAGKQWQPAPSPEATGLPDTSVPTSTEPGARSGIETGMPRPPEITKPAPGGDVVTSPAAWQDKAQFIEEFTEAIRQVTRLETGASASPRASAERTPSAVTLDALATQFHIISPSPTASIALKSITNLRDAAGRGSQSPNEDDVFQVNQFHQILMRNGEQIARAIILGAVVGRADTDASPDERIAAGLGVIARAMQFVTKREGDVATSLENVSAMVDQQYNQGLEGQLKAIGTAWPSLAKFVELTTYSVEAAFNLLVDDTTYLANSSWKDAQNRVLQWIRTSDMLEPSLHEMLAASVGVGPTDLLEFDVRQMTLHQWTRTLLAARHSVPWLTLVCWHAMGFRTSIPLDLQVFANWAGLPPDFTDPATPSHHSWSWELRQAHQALHGGTLLRGEIPATTLVVLRRTKSPMTAAWRPVRDVATLVMTAAELTSVMAPGPVQSSTVLMFPITTDYICAVEMEPEIGLELSNTQLPAIKSLLPGSVRLIYAYPAERGREMKGPFVVAPADQAAIIKATRQSGQSFLL